MNIPASTGFLKLADLLTVGAAAVTGGVVDLVRMDEVRLTAAGREGSFSAGLGRRVRGGGLGLASESAEDSLLLREGDLIKEWMYNQRPFLSVS